MKTIFFCTTAIASKSIPSLRKQQYADINTLKRPVIGILTEPIRGDIIGDIKALSYIPKPHV